MRMHVELLTVWLLVLLSGNSAAGDDTGVWSAEVEGTVRKVIAGSGSGRDGAGPAPVVVFDFDNTMILGDIGLAATVIQVRQRRFGFDPGRAGGPFPPELVALFRKAGKTDDVAQKAALQRQVTYRVLRVYFDRWHAGHEEQALAYLAKLEQGMTKDEVAALALDTLRTGLRSPMCLLEYEPAGARGAPIVELAGIRLRPAIQSMVSRFHAARFEVWVVSASPHRLVQAAARQYGIPADRVLGVRSREQDGRLTGEVLKPITYRKGKVEAIEKFIGRRPVVAFGDAWTDFEMLRYAEHGVLVHRADSQLAARCREHGILVQPGFAAEPVPEPCAPGWTQGR